VCICLRTEDGETGREDGGILQSAVRGVGVPCFSLRGNNRDTDKGLTGNPSRMCLFARQDTIEGDGAEMNPESDRDSPVPRCRFRPHNVGTPAPRPGDVLTDVILKLTFDNTAYVEETSAAALTTGVLPNSLTTYLLTYLFIYRQQRHAGSKTLLQQNSPVLN